MEIFEKFNIIITISVISICILFISILFDFISLLWRFPSKIRKKTWNDSATGKPELYKQYEEILYFKSKYYQSLSSENKKIFLIRTKQFIDNTTFEAYDIPEVTFETKVLIAATAIQLTFGLKYSLSSTIRTIRIYPDMVYSKMFKGYLKGFFHPHGIIQLSQKHFIADIENNTDGLNLGLHEMAHALDFSILRKMEFKFFFYDLVKKWFDKAKQENQLELSDNDDVTGFIRKYGATNIHEFFAVCVENFFERPQEFASKMPLIYKHLTCILNQNPLEQTIKEIPTPIHIEGNKPIFVEPINIKEIIIISTISTIALFFIFFNYFDFFRPIAFIILFYNFSKIFGFITTKRMEFYDDYIIIKSILFGTYKILNTKSILYIAAYQTSTRTPKQFLSFVYYNNKLQEKHDTMIITKDFLPAVETYANRNNFIFINKTSNSLKN